MELIVSLIIIYVLYKLIQKASKTKSAHSSNIVLNRKTKYDQFKSDYKEPNIPNSQK
jgi:amino acid permease